MTTKRKQRAIEVLGLKTQTVEATTAIVRLVESLPVDANLGTHRAIRNHVVRTFNDVQDFVERENARREARNG